MNLPFLHELAMAASTKMVMIVLDGLGGLPKDPGGMTELETANTPNMDRLAQGSILGLTLPAGHGITVESGPGHLALFGYDPIQHAIGRGVLEALGLDLALEPGDVAIRGNYCTVGESGIVIDRRAGRIADEISRDLSGKISIRIEDIDISVETVREHRLSIILRGPGLDDQVTSSDPQQNGFPPLPIKPLSSAAEKTARVINQFVDHARAVMADYRPKSPANMILLRGIDSNPHLPTFPDLFHMRAAAVAVYPTYRGIARLLDMTVLPVEGSSFTDEFSTLEANWERFDFFYLHIKQTDLAGEDGDFDRKVSLLEEIDTQIPRVEKLNPDVLVICGDHSTPAVLKSHSWHPVPILIHGRYVRSDRLNQFGESACSRGSLGTIPACEVMPLVLANALRLHKYTG